MGFWEPHLGGFDRTHVRLEDPLDGPHFGGVLGRR